MSSNRKFARALYNRNISEYMVLDVVQRTTQIFNNYENLLQQKNSYIKQLEESKASYIDPGLYVDEGVEVKINSTITMQYFQYIEKYGIPADGIFIQSLLDEFA